MAYIFQYNCNNINWQEVSNILREVGMAWYPPEIQQKAFENSRVVVFAFDDNRLAGFGRVLSDGAYQAAVYDMAIIPEYQGKGIGSRIMRHFLEELPQCNFILYASPGKEAFYQKLEFRTMKTGMALFLDRDRMKERGFTD